MARKSSLTPEQLAKIEELLKAKTPVSKIASETGAKDYQINAFKRKLGMVKPRKAKKAAKAPAPKAARTPVKAKAKAGAPLSLDAIRARLAAAQKEVVAWQERLVARVSEIEKMINTIKKI